MTPSTAEIRVLIAEDSPVARELLTSILQNSPNLQVVGVARNGVEAVRLAKRLKPDVITMDVHMPEMDGFEASRRIMSESPCPIVIISSITNKKEQNLSFNALQAGALSVLDKPTMYDPPEVLDALANHVRLMSEVKVVRRWNRGSKAQTAAKETPALQQNGKSAIEMVVVASSTGGPGILAEILGRLPENFGAPILIVQHITPGFGQGLARWLNQQTPLEVRLAKHADEPVAGQVLIAPDNHHMVVNNLGRITLNQDVPYHGLRPAADYLFTSVAKIYGSRAVGVVLSGMGSDGAEGLLAMHKVGAHTIAQDKETCVVFGMPAVAIEMGAAEQVLPMHQIGPALVALV